MRRRYGLSAFVLVQLTGTLVLFALFYGLFDAIALDFFAAGKAHGGDVQQGAEWHEYAWRFGPALLLTMVGTRIISRAIFESRGGVS